MHHLFPAVDPVHFPELMPIFFSTLKEFGEVRFHNVFHTIFLATIIFLYEKQEGRHNESASFFEYQLNMFKWAMNGEFLGKDGRRKKQD